MRHNNILGEKNSMKCMQFVNEDTKNKHKINEENIVRSNFRDRSKIVQELLFFGNISR